MPVAFTSAGYGGAVTQESWAALAAALGHTYSVNGSASWEVAPATGDRAITVSSGEGYGYGVTDSTTDSESLFIPAVTTGTTRYDMVVARRDWSTKTTSFDIVSGGSVRALPARTKNPGFLDEQPIALVRVAAGSTAIQEIIDLRLWGTNGGMFAKSDLVRSYITEIGSQINIAGVVWGLRIGSDGIVDWVIQSKIGRIPLFGVRDTLEGGAPADGEQFLVQSGTHITVTDDAGYARLPWPKPFPNGLISVTLTNGDDWAPGSITFFSVAGRENVWGQAGIGSKTEVVYVMEGSDSGGNNWRKIARSRHRINYIAIGW